MSTVTLPLLSRLSVVRVDKQLIITIPSRKSKLDMSLHGVGFLFWLGVSVTAVQRHFFGPLVNDLSLGVGLLLWLGLGSAVVWHLLWQMYGCEVLEVSGCVLKRRWQLFGLGWTWAYMASGIDRLQAVPQVNVANGRNPSFFRHQTNRPGIVFDYGPKTVHLGQSVNAEEAKAIVATIQAQFPQYI
ncbi:MAG: hypothetical protein GY796_05355 [Chloroflexi bacterium]|nr:hypothetical protein [Chloroflexota bacterium]